MSIEYIIPARVHDVIHKTRATNIRRIAGTDQVTHDEVDLGWYLHLAGSHEALYLGTEKPELKPGDKVEIRIRKKPP